MGWGKQVQITMVLTPGGSLTKTCVAHQRTRLSRKPLPAGEHFRTDPFRLGKTRSSDAIRMHFDAYCGVPDHAGIVTCRIALLLAGKKYQNIPLTRYFCWYCDETRVFWSMWVVFAWFPMAFSGSLWQKRGLSPPARAPPMYRENTPLTRNFWFADVLHIFWGVTECHVNAWWPHFWRKGGGKALPSMPCNAVSLPIVGMPIHFSLASKLAINLLRFRGFDYQTL